MYDIGDVLEHKSVFRNGAFLLGIVEKKIGDDIILRIQEGSSDAHHAKLRYKERQLGNDWRPAYVK